MPRAVTLLLLVCAMLFFIGCSSFLNYPQTARIHITGPGNHSKELTICLDDPLNRDKDIHLTDRYAVEIFFQWLWYEKEDLDTYGGENGDEGTLSRPIPWFLCKYRF
ncbi:MAG: hypothetical protein HKP58_17015 [Desulfatitalea sp.]|nr:hypothetical protein [Desulfatitalea sp.]NNK02115.1 hypothetical protein [Desulfatitalea sp.]